MSITILSWDIGVSNLSYCLLQYQNDKKNITTKTKIGIDGIISNDKFINLKDTSINDIGDKTTIKHWGILDISGNIDDCSQDNYTFFSNLEDLKAKNCDNDDIEITMKQMKGLGKKNIIIDTESKSKTKTEKKNKTKNKKETKSKKENEKNNKGKKKKPKKKKYDVNVISVILFKKLDELMTDIARNTDINSDMIDYILIENQPSLKNPKMKTIQVLVYSYFMIRTKIDVVDIVDTDNIDYKIDDSIDNDTDNMITTPNIQFVSALGKLKYCKDEEIEKMFNHLKSKYTIRKKKGIEYCKLYMGDKDIPNNNFFESNKKKDDFADSYLQAVQFMFKTKK